MQNDATRNSTRNQTSTNHQYDYDLFYSECVVELANIAEMILLVCGQIIFVMGPHACEVTDRIYCGARRH